MTRLILRVGGVRLAIYLLIMTGREGCVWFYLLFFCLPIPVCKGFDYDLARPYLYTPSFSLPSCMEISAVEAVQQAKAEFWKICQGLLLVFHSGFLLALSHNLVCPSKTCLDFFYC